MDYDRVIEDNPELRRWQVGVCWWPGDLLTPLLQYCVAALLWLPTLSAGLNIMSYTFAGQITARIC